MAPWFEVFFGALEVLTVHILHDLCSVELNVVYSWSNFTSKERLILQRPCQTQLTKNIQKLNANPKWIITINNRVISKTVFTEIPKEICTHLEGRCRQKISQDGEKHAKNQAKENVISCYKTIVGKIFNEIRQKRPCWASFLPFH